MPPAGVAMDSQEYARWELGLPSESEQAWTKLQALADYEDRYGDALRLNMSDDEICAWAKKLAEDVEEFDNRIVAHAQQTLSFPKLQAASAKVILQARVNGVRRIVDMLGVEVSKPIEGNPTLLAPSAPAGGAVACAVTSPAWWKLGPSAWVWYI